MLYESPNIRVEFDDQVATLWLDRDDSPTNRLTTSMLDELDAALQAIRGLPCVDVLLVRSAKSGEFCTGLDLNEYESVDATALAGRGQQTLQMLSNLRPNMTTVAVIEGACRSQGLELALACDRRFVVAAPRASFAFPDVHLGLAPCWGGAVRLPKLIGLRPALNLLLNGEGVSAGQALRIGLIDHLCEPREFKARLQTLVDQLQDGARPLPTPRRLVERLAIGTSFGRWMTYRATDTLIDDVDGAERPAVRAIHRAVWAGISSAVEGFAAERALLPVLLDTDACRTALAQARLAEQPSRIYPEPINPTPARPERLGIVGGGELGAQLAVFFAMHGSDVVVQEYAEETLAAANERIDNVVAGKLQAGELTRATADQLRKAIRRTANWTGFDRVQWVIEAVDEDLGIKRGIISELERQLRPRTIIASTSTTLRIEAMQAEMQRPGRLVGLHPVDMASRGSLVEVVRAPATDSSTLASLCEWLRGWGMLPLVVGDRPGRLVTRVRMNYLSEAVQLVAEGLPPEAIDRDLRRFGMPAGPLEQIDRIGFQRLANLTENMQLARGDRFARNLLLERMRGFGCDGRESGEGFYLYRGGRTRPSQLARMINWNDSDEDVISHYVFDPEESLELGVERLILRTINEAAAALSDESDLDPALVDLGLARGMGWAPHRGGPLLHADKLGLANVVDRLAEFSERFGRRFEPCVELQRRAEAGESFYGSAVPDDAIIEFPKAAAWRLAG